MPEGFYDQLRRENPEMMEKLHFRAEVGEFPESCMDLKAEQLPLEEYDSFSDDPLEFEEYTAALMEDVYQIYTFSRILNRFSEKYRNVSLQLEKGLAKLAGCCVTKAVLEKKGFSFPVLENLAIKPLYCAVSFNFRKVHAAVKETTNKNYRMWAQLIDIEFGWHALAERLKATEEKILGIQSGKINVDTMINRIRLFREDKAHAVSSRTQQTVPAGKAYAYPVLGSVVREMTSREKGTVPGGTELCRRSLLPLSLQEKDQEESGGDREIRSKAPVGQSPMVQHYDSIKQRKKAERLARKHARKEGTNVPECDNGSSLIDTTAAQSELTAPNDDLNMFEFVQQHLEGLRSSRKVPVPVGGPLPQRA